MKGMLPELTPLERWEISQPGNILRVFERGAGKKGKSPIRIAKRNPGVPTTNSETEASALYCAPILFFSVFRKHVSPTHYFPCPARTTNRVTIAAVAARDAMWFMPTIARQSIPVLTLNTVISGKAFRRIPRFQK